MDSSNSSSIQAANSLLLNSGKFSDVTFVLGENKDKVKAHKLILMSRSEVFEAMFERWETAKDCLIEIPEVSGHEFKAFLGFLYSNKFLVLEEDCEGILYLARKYDVQALETMTANFLISKLTPKNAVRIFQMANVLDHRDLLLKSLGFIFAHGKAIFGGEEFLTMELSTLCGILQNDGLELAEIDVFQAMIRWAEHACTDRKLDSTIENKRKVLEPIVPFIRFPLMPVEIFTEEVVNKNRGFLTDAETIQLFTYFNAGYYLKEQLSVAPFNKNPRFSRCVYSVTIYLLAREDQPCYSRPIFDQLLTFCVDRDITLVGFQFFEIQLLPLASTSSSSSSLRRVVEPGRTRKSPDGILVVQDAQDQVIYSDRIQVKSFIGTNRGNFLMTDQIKLVKNSLYKIRISIGKLSSFGVGSNLSSRVTVICGTTVVSFNFSHTPYTPFGLLKGLSFKL